MERIKTLRPERGKTGPNILRWKCEAVSRAILAVLPTREPGIPFGELSERVREALPPDEREDLGSIPWYTVTVMMDLEARREVARVAGVRPQRRVRVTR